MTFEEICAKVPGVRVHGYKATGLCVAHSDKHPSLSLLNGGDRTLLHCFAGCSPQAICSFLGIELSDLFVEPKAQGKPTQNGQKNRLHDETGSPYHTSKLLREYAHKLLDIADSYEHQSWKVLEQAQGLGIDDWTDEELDRALFIVDKALKKQRLVTALDDLAGDLKLVAMEKQRTAHASRT